MEILSGTRQTLNLDPLFDEFGTQGFMVVSEQYGGIFKCLLLIAEFRTAACRFHFLVVFYKRFNDYFIELFTGHTNHHLLYGMVTLYHREELKLLEKVTLLVIGLVATVVLAAIAGVFWGAIIFGVANYLIGFPVTFLQAFGCGVLFHFISNAIRNGIKD